MKHRQQTRPQQTRERIRAAALRLFLQQGYLATSVNAILGEAGVSSTETFYRHYGNKEDLFVDILGYLTLEQPSFSAKLLTLPTPHDLPSLQETLVQLSRELVSVMSQPEYLALLRIMIAEAPRFPQLGPLFFSTIPQRGLSIIITLLQEAKEQHIIADVDLEVVTRTLIGGLASYVIPGLILAREQVQPLSLDRADAVVEVIMRTLTP